MAFSWSTFLTKLEAIAEPLTIGILTLKNETGQVGSLQEAQDAAALATGVTEALGNPEAGAIATQANQALQAVVAGIAASHPAIVAAQTQGATPASK